jgi:hypothetical protein
MAQAGYVPSANRVLFTDANLDPSTKHVSTTYAALIGELVGHPPRPIPLAAHAVDLEERADHLTTVLSALSAYLTASLDDAAQNVPGGLDLRQIEALLSDLAADTSGTLRYAAEATAWRVA